jgi:hypothetical protein
MDAGQTAELQDSDGRGWYLFRCPECHCALHMATLQPREDQDIRDLRMACLNCMRLKAIEVSAHLGPFGIARVGSR